MRTMNAVSPRSNASAIVCPRLVCKVLAVEPGPAATAASAGPLDALQSAPVPNWASTGVFAPDAMTKVFPQGGDMRPPAHKLSGGARSCLDLDQNGPPGRSMAARPRGAAKF